jgi:maltooligosyltrehalose trehalohydrolase
MRILPLGQLGARERAAAPGTIDFGLLLPGVTPADGTVVAQIIHVDDQFIQAVPPVVVSLVHSVLGSGAASFGDYWSGSVDTTDPKLKPPAARGWGGDKSARRYVYRYALTGRPNGQPDIIDILDPFAREFGYGDVAAVTLGADGDPFATPAQTAIEAAFRVPPIHRAILYECNVAEFGGDVDKTLGLLDYLADLGINVIEVMPVNNTAARIDWGYDPLGYFGVTSRLGRAADLQRLVAAAHARGIAVVLDSVYGHVEGRFAYSRVYDALGKPNPFIGPFAEDQFFESTDFSKSLTQDYFFTNNVFWLETFHIDGFRYDDVPEYWDEKRPVGSQGYSDLVLATYQHVDAAVRAASAAYTRFAPSSPGGDITLIQIAEYLPDPPHVLFGSVSNSTWQNQTMDAAKGCARGQPGALADFAFKLGLQFFPDALPQAGVTIQKSALQYIENHDHERFICTFGTHFPDKNDTDPLLLLGNRDSQWFKVQPYLIGLLTAKGTPLLWQGQEFCQDDFVPDSGNGRVGVYRPVDFNYFYDPIGRALIRLVRKLIAIRRAGAEFTSGDHFFFNEPQYVNRGVMLFSRKSNGTFSLVALNFTDSDANGLSFAFPKSGTFSEQIEGKVNFGGVTAGVPVSLSVPSNYGCIWTG